VAVVHIYTQTIHRTIQNKQYIEQHNNWKNWNYYYYYASVIVVVNVFVIVVVAVFLYMEICQ